MFRVVPPIIDQNAVSWQPLRLHGAETLVSVRETRVLKFV
jgi:hypothetical protein